MYPLYFDLGRSLEMGRRVTKSEATLQPNIHDISEAAKQLGYEIVIEVILAASAYEYKAGYRATNGIQRIPFCWAELK